MLMVLGNMILSFLITLRRLGKLLWRHESSLGFPRSMLSKFYGSFIITFNFSILRCVQLYGFIDIFQLYFLALILLIVLVDVVARFLEARIHFHISKYFIHLEINLKSCKLISYFLLAELRVSLVILLHYTSEITMKSYFRAWLEHFQ